MVLTPDDILDFVKKNGPLLSIKVAKHFKINTTYAGAYLSELVSKKEIKFTHLKIGTSPLYYLDSQKEKLQDYSDKLNNIEKRAFDLLKEKKILRNSNQDNVIKAALRNIKDYAVSLVVHFKNQKEIFWKFYLLDNNGAQKIIKNMLTPKKAEVKEKAEKREISTDKIKEGTPEKEVKKDISKQKQEFLEKQKKIKEREKEILKEKEMSETKVSEHDQKSTISDKIEKELHIKIEKEYKELEKQRKEFLSQQKEIQKQRQELLQLMKEIKQEKQELERLRIKPESKISEQEKVISISQRIAKEKNQFFQKVNEFLNTNNMKIKDYEIIKKGEIDLVITVPAAIGTVDYYCCAKSKKRSNEGDLSTAYIKGQNKKLPVLYLSPGSVTKKAQEMLNKEFKNMVVKNIE